MIWLHQRNSTCVITKSVFGSLEPIYTCQIILCVGIAEEVLIIFNAFFNDGSLFECVYRIIGKSHCSTYFHDIGYA